MAKKSSNGLVSERNLTQQDFNKKKNSRMKNIKIVFLLIFAVANIGQITAGNPDRQGEAGAYELLLNPWARSAGLHTMNTSFVKGVEAMRLNVAGLSRINKTEVLIGNARLFEGTGILLNSVGVAQRMGENGTLGLSLMAVDFGDIPVTTTDIPGGNGATFSPNFFNIGIGYSHIFENKISVGVLFRAISESTADIKAFGFGVDAGIQYVSGENDNFKFGISLRNVGSPMQYRGPGLSFIVNSQELPQDNGLAVSTEANRFELPSLLNIGISYDFLIGLKNRLTVAGNFTSNSFSRDQLSAGVEYAFNEIFMLRGGYRYDIGQSLNALDRNVYTGVSAGASAEIPLKKGSSNRLGIDYAYRFTNPFNGTHNIGIRITI